MSSDKCCYCWVRVLDAGGAASGESERVSDCEEQKAPTGPLKFMAGGRPPYVQAQGSPGNAGKDEGDAKPSSEQHFWTLSPLFCGDPGSGLVLDYGPAFHRAHDAMAWIGGQPGLKWAAESKNYFLMAFLRDPDLQPGTPALLPVSRMKGSRPAHWGYFPCAHWEAKFAQIGCTLPPVKLLDFDALKLTYPAGDLDDECRRLKKLKPLRKGLEAKIRTQAQSDLHAIQPVLDVLRINLLRLPQPSLLVPLLALRDSIQQNILHAVFLFKREVLRDRPWNGCDASLQPMFLRPDRLYPGHPSYPSGHATLAFTWAALLSKVRPKKAKELEEAANEVALLREVAGVHFRSDSDAGRQLGEQIADGIWATLSDRGLDPELSQALDQLVAQANSQ